MTSSQRTGDPEHARELNRAIVLNAFRGNAKTSRADLVHRLHLSKVTISSIVSELVRDHLLVETGEGTSQPSGGRKPILLSLNTERKRVIGIDIGATAINGALSDLGGRLLARCRRATPTSRSVRSVVSQVGSIVGELLRTEKSSGGSVLGVGMSAAGIVESSSGVVRFSPDFNWKQVALGELIREATGLDVAVDNCTRAMALGEQWFVKARGLRNAFYVNVGYGVGSAIIANSQVYDNHSEFGHLFVTRPGTKCYCGKTGCLETVSSGHAIERRAQEVLKPRRGEWITARALAERALRGDRQAPRCWARSGVSSRSMPWT